MAIAFGSACVLQPLIESVAGLDATDSLAPSPQVLSLAFGIHDFSADTGMACGSDELGLTTVRPAVVPA